MANRAIGTTAREVFGWDRLRDGQEEAVAALLEGRDVIAVLPTGAGKSAVYQLAGTMRPGVTIIVSPLIALQVDQLAQFESRPDAPAAVAINSTMTDGEVADAWASLASGVARYVYLSPEQLSREQTKERLRGLEIGLLAVDEAHCVASWGHDFRPDYLRLDAVRRDIGAPPTVALTATGAEPVRREIQERLGLDDPLVVVREVDRPNITLEVVREPTAEAKRTAVLELLSSMAGPGLLYTATRRETEEYASDLRQEGIRAEAYHAGLRAAARAQVHREFLDDALDVVVATNAFGMGIDKPNVRFVVHAAVPESLDAYYQEIGRAGRDGAAARATLFYRSEDLALRKYFAAGGVDEGRLMRVHAEIAASDGPVASRTIGDAVGLSTRAVTAAVNLLVEGGGVEVGRRGVTAIDHATGADAVAAAVEAAERRTRIEQSRLEVMRRYAETRDCRRRLLLGYFGDEIAEPCGNCDICRDGGPMRRDGVSGAGSYPAGSPVEHVEWGRGSVVDAEGDRLTVFFDEQGYKVLALDVVEANGLLVRADA